MLRTDRLLLRAWRDEDRAPYATLNADPEVRRWFPGLLTRAESDAQIDRLQADIEERGYGFWALEAPGIAPFIGFVGLQPVPFDAPFTPAVEIGWRLARASWKQGFATEAARAALAHGFGPLGLAEIVAITVPGNRPSRRVMERIGMTHDADGDFDHPNVAAGHPLRRHVLYRLAGTTADVEWLDAAPDRGTGVGRDGGGAVAPREVAPAFGAAQSASSGSKR